MKRILLGMILGILGVVSFSALGVPFDLVTPVTDTYSQIEPSTFTTGFIVPGSTIPLIRSEAVDSFGTVKGVVTVEKKKGALVCTLTGHMARAGKVPNCPGLTVAEFDAFVSARESNAHTLWQKLGLKKP